MISILFFRAITSGRIRAQGLLYRNIKRQEGVASSVHRKWSCFSIDIALTRGHILKGLEVQEKIRKME
jgi:hypothetical protein